jgi:copper(I)-binding protein
MLRFLTLIVAFVSFFSQAHISVTNATVRLLPPGLPNTAAYFTIENDTYTDLFLVGANSKIVKNAELHNHFSDGEVMRMEKQDKVKIPAGETVKFQPGGLHVMLFGLKKPLKEGQSVPLSVITEQGTLIDFDAKVVMPGQESNGTHQHH